MARSARDSRSTGRASPRTITRLHGWLTGTGKAIRASARARRWIAVRASLALGVPMLAGAASGHLVEGTQASLGGFIALYGAGHPYRRRAVLMAVLIVAFPVAMILGTLVGGHPVAAVAVGLVGGVLWTLVVLAIRIGPPREYFVLLVYLLATVMPEDPGAWASRGALIAAGSAFGALVAMSPWLLRHPGPVPGTVAAANDAVARLLDAIGDVRTETLVHDTIVAVRAALVATDQAERPSELVWAQRTAAIEQVLDAALALHVDASGPIAPGWAARLRAAATSTTERRTGEVDPPDPPVPDGPAGLLLADAVARAEAAWRAETPGPARVSDLELATSWREPARWTFSRVSPHRRIAVRIGLAVGGGLAIGYVAGLAHPSWVGLSAASVLQNRTVSGARSRGLNRAVGTAIGVIVAGALFSLDPSDAVKIAGVVVLQFVVQLVLRGSYGVAVIGITTMVLFQISLLGAGTVASLLDARVVDTFVGCAFAVLLLVLLPPRKHTERLEQAQAGTLRATGTLLAHALDPGHPSATVRADRDRLHARIRLLRAAEEAATGEAFGLDPIADARWPLTATIDRIGRLALAVPGQPPWSVEPSVDDAAPDAGSVRRTAGAAPFVPDVAARARLDDRFEALARRVEGDRSPSPYLDQPVPLRTPLPRISEALEELRRQLEDLD